MTETPRPDDAASTDAAGARGRRRERAPPAVRRRRAFATCSAWGRSSPSRSTTTPGIPLGTALQFTRPLYAELLRGSTISLIIAGAFAAGGRLPLWAVLLAPIPYTMLTDPFYYWAGRRYGRPLVAYLEKHDRRWHRRARRAESFFARWGLVGHPLRVLPARPQRPPLLRCRRRAHQLLAVHRHRRGGHAALHRAVGGAGLRHRQAGGERRRRRGSVQRADHHRAGGGDRA